MTDCFHPYLAKVMAEHPDQSINLTELNDWYQKKLYHQLTLKISEMLRTDSDNSGSSKNSENSESSKNSGSGKFWKRAPNFWQLYQSFIADLAKFLNPVSVSHFALIAANQYQVVNQSNGQSIDQSINATREFLSSVEKSVGDDKQAIVMLNLARARFDLKAGQTEVAKQSINQCKTKLDLFEGVMDASIYGLYYQTLCELADIEQDSAAFYQNALLYLTYTRLDTLGEDEKLELAEKLALSALSGNTVYNFGELLSHPIFEYLTKSQQHAWLARFLHIFNSGNMEAFNGGLIEAAERAPELQKHIPLLQQKIRIMALIDLAFQRPSQQRVFTFKEIASACQVEANQSEWLLMKALALKVIKGRIDQVKQQVRVGWVQARALNPEQLATLKDRVKDWTTRLQDSIHYIETNASIMVPAGQA